MDNLILLSNIILGVAGFLIAANICHKKWVRKPMVCPLNMKCEDVLYSKYAKFLGVPLDVLGMFYYSLIIVGNYILLFQPSLRSQPLILAIFLLSTGGFLFSAYLVSVQVFKLKEFCSWCLASATISSLIFFANTQSNLFISGLATLVYTYKFTIVVAMAMATSLGLGISTVTEILFINFLSDYSISPDESHTMHILRQINWLVLGLTALFNYGFYMANRATVAMSPIFSTKVFILILLAGASLVYDLFISSRLTAIYPPDSSTTNNNSRYLKKGPLIFGPIIVICWFLVFVLEMIGGV